MTEHYFSRDPEVESAPEPVVVTLPDMTFEVLSDRGIFSVGALDRGTKFLLRAAPAIPDGATLLDLGCGYGVIALVAARRAPHARVWAVDTNRRAVELTERNAAALGITTVVAMFPDDVPPDVRFDVIYSNPPIRIGKQELHAMLTRWLDRLTPDGRAFLVVQRHLGADSLGAWLTEQGYPTRRLRSRQGYRLLEVSPAARAPADAPSSGA